MKQQQNTTLGSIVQSLAGHDKGAFFVVCEEQNDFVCLVDGNYRKFANPKKKKRKHVKLIAQSQALHDKFSAKQKVFDSEVFSQLKIYNKQKGAAK